ncbi:hypothetical protein TgHK011_002629 [Trichoderma gracile]|nr:hypothetical protein TgHK011_002629 [Trichoderma gracile]
MARDGQTNRFDVVTKYLVVKLKHLQVPYIYLHYIYILHTLKENPLSHQIVTPYSHRVWNHNSHAELRSAIFTTLERYLSTTRAATFEINP